MSIELEQEKLNETGELLQATSIFWRERMMRLAAKVNAVVAKIDSDPKQELFDELDHLRLLIKNLEIKGNWELSQVKIFEQKQKDLEKQSNIDFKSNLKRKLSKNLLRS